MIEVLRELEQPDVWSNPELAQELGKERARLENIVNTIDSLEKALTESTEFLKLAEEEGDGETVAAVLEDLEVNETQLGKLEFRRMFSGEMDANNALSLIHI